MGGILHSMQSGWAAISQLWAHAAPDQSAAGPGVPQDQPVAAHVTNPGPVSVPRSKRILVFGDASAYPVARALHDAGYTVNEVSSLPLALAGLERAPVAVIVLDCPEVVANCRALRRVTGVPILALLPELSEAAVLDALAAGADDCQAATISPPEIVLRVRAILRRGKAQAPVSGAGPFDFDNDAQMRKAT